MANQCVLLVDANGSALRQARITLEFEGLEVIEALDGEQGLAAARKHRPELVITAVGLPKLNGYDLCRSIREESVLAETPVLLTFSSMDVFDAARAERVGASASLAKPFLPSQLLDKIARIAGSSFLGSDHQDLAAASQSADALLTSAESAFLEDSTDEPHTLGSDFVTSVEEAIDSSGRPIGAASPFAGALGSDHGDATSSSGPSFSSAKAARPSMGPPQIRPPESDLQEMIQAAVTRYLDEHLGPQIEALIDAKLAERKP